MEQATNELGLIGFIDELINEVKTIFKDENIKKQPQILCITGQPGTGKSSVIKKIGKYFKNSKKPSLIEFTPPEETVSHRTLEKLIHELGKHLCKNWLSRIYYLLLYIIIWIEIIYAYKHLIIIIPNYNVAYDILLFAFRYIMLSFITLFIVFLIFLIIDNVRPGLRKRLESYIESIGLVKPQEMLGILLLVSVLMAITGGIFSGYLSALPDFVQRNEMQKWIYIFVIIIITVSSLWFLIYILGRHIFQKTEPNRHSKMIIALKKALKKQPILVIVDDIDSMFPDQMTQLFEAIRHLQAEGLPNLMFLLAMDRRVAERALAGQQTSNELLIKLVDYWFEMPPLSQNRLDGILLAKIKEAFTRKLVNKNLGSIQAKDLEAITHVVRRAQDECALAYNLAYQPFFRTPRDIVHFVDGFIRSVDRFIKAEAIKTPDPDGVGFSIDIGDLFGIEVLRLFEPEIYEDLSKRAELFATYNTVRAEGVDRDVDLVRERLLRLPEELLARVSPEQKSRRDRLNRVLRELLPRKPWLREDEIEAIFQTLRRLTSYLQLYLFWCKYFLDSYEHPLTIAAERYTRKLHLLCPSIEAIRRWRAECTRLAFISKSEDDLATMLMALPINVETCVALYRWCKGELPQSPQNDINRKTYWKDLAAYIQDMAKNSEHHRDQLADVWELLDTSIVYERIFNNGDQKDTLALRLGLQQRKVNEKVIQSALKDLTRYHFWKDLEEFLTEMTEDPQIRFLHEHLARNYLKGHIQVLRDCKEVLNALCGTQRNCQESPWALCHPENFHFYFSPSTIIPTEIQNQGDSDYKQQQTCLNVLISDLNNKEPDPFLKLLKRTRTTLHYFIKDRRIRREFKDKYISSIYREVEIDLEEYTKENYIVNIIYMFMCSIHKRKSRLIIDEPNKSLDEITNDIIIYNEFRRLAIEFERRVYRSADHTLRRLARWYWKHPQELPQDGGALINLLCEALKLINKSMINNNAIAESNGISNDWKSIEMNRHWRQDLYGMFILNVAVRDFVEQVLHIYSEYRQSSTPTSAEILEEVIRQSDSLFGSISIAFHFMRGTEIRKKTLWKKCGLPEQELLDKTINVCRNKIKEKLKDEALYEEEPLFFILYIWKHSVGKILDGQNEWTATRFIKESLSDQEDNKVKKFINAFATSALFLKPRIRHSDGERTATVKYGFDKRYHVNRILLEQLLEPEGGIENESDAKQFYSETESTNHKNQSLLNLLIEKLEMQKHRVSSTDTDKINIGISEMLKTCYKIRQSLELTQPHTYN